jgi:FlaA1/EpsC-like NDP-sugar epimerase
VTVTSAEMTRYFMTIPEAVRLILHAGAVGETGNVHVLNMGQPIRIVDLARDLIRLSSPAGAKDIQIAFTGLRPGEKLEESLFGPDEEAVETGHPFLLIARPTDAEGHPNARAGAADLEALACRGDDDRLRTALVQTHATMTTS